jgi:hypothetical protein
MGHRVSPSVAAMDCAGRTAPAVRKPERGLTGPLLRRRNARGPCEKQMAAVTALITRRVQEEAEEERAPCRRRCPAARRGRAAGRGDRTAPGWCERRNRCLMLGVRTGLSRPVAMHSRVGAGVGFGGRSRRRRQSRWGETRSLRGHRARRRGSQSGQGHGHGFARVTLVHDHGLDGQRGSSRCSAPLRPARRDRGGRDRRRRGDPARLDGRRAGPRSCPVGLGGIGRRRHCRDLGIGHLSVAGRS